MYLVDKTTMITVTIMDKWKNDWSFARKAEMSKKAIFFICHIAILEIMCIINEWDPNTVFEDSAKTQHLYKAVK